MDTDFCLSCEKHWEGNQSPYCSPECLAAASPSTSSQHVNASFFTRSEDDCTIFHDIVEVSPTSRVQSIADWRMGVNPGPPQEDAPSPAPSSLVPRTSPVPKLIRLHSRPIAPTMALSIAHPSLPAASTPIRTPQQHISSMARASASVESLFSDVTESLIATPISLQPRSAVFSLATQMKKSWVNSSPLHTKRPSLLPQSSSRISKVTTVHLPSPPSSFDGSDESDDHWFGDRKSVATTELTHPETHPAYLTRGRKPSRAIV